MTAKLQRAIDNARSGQSFVESGLLDHGFTAGEIKAARDYIGRHPDVSSYILLMALRRHHQQAYAGLSDETKAKVLCDAIKKLTVLNDFGHLGPNAYDDDAAAALIGLGRTAAGHLRPLLDDRNEGVLFGSEEATMSRVYRYRRGDFAYRYIMLIHGREPAFPADPAERDKLIAALQKELASAD